jgi:N-acetylmuramoyl-L-alanine amidase
LTSIVREGVVYHRLDEVASSLSAMVSWIPARRRAAVVTSTDSIAVTVDSRFFTLNGRGIILDHPVIYTEGSVLVPEAFVKAIPSLLTSARAAWVDSLGQLQVEGTPCDIEVIRVIEDSIAVHLELSLPSYAEWDLSPFQGDSVVLAVHGATVCTSDFDSLLTDSSAVFVVARQEPGRAILVAHRSQPGIHARCTARGTSLIWSLGELPADRRWTRPIRRIVIDAGHGGSDLGARSSDGIAEKDVNLTVATRLAGVLRDELDDIDVVLIRDDDLDIPSSLRIERANAAGADLFVSIHCNWSFDHSLRGLQASFPTPGHVGPTKAVVSRDGVVESPESDGGSGESLETLLPWDTASNKWLPASKALANVVTEAFTARGLPARTPLQAPLEGLHGLAMPSVLVEVGYLSNPMERRDLVAREHLHLVAEILASGISRFIVTPDKSEDQQ